MGRLIRNFFKKPSYAQSAAELAIFGAILLFVVGLIFRAGMNASLGTNMQLRAMRYALSESYRTARGDYSIPNGRAAAGRNPATLVLVEDRLSGDLGGKMRSSDRSPLVTSSGGTFTNTNFLTQLFNEKENLPMYDLIVNGQRFPLAQAGYRSIAYYSQCSGTGCRPKPATCVCTAIDAYSCRPTNPANCNNMSNVNPIVYILPDCVGTTADWHPPAAQGICWQKKCLDNGAGCPVFYTMVGNYPNSDQWNSCCTSGAGCNATSVASCQYRFDLDFNGSPEVPLNQRAGFNWQWNRVPGVLNSRVASDLDTSSTAFGSSKVQGIDTEDQINTAANVDLDEKQEENIFSLQADGNDVITVLNVMDLQKGDIDFTDTNPTRRPGLQQDKQMYSFETYKSGGTGTTFSVQAGRIFPSILRRFTSTINRQEHMDVIQRVLLLSNDTGRFCQGGVPRDWTSSPPPGAATMTNPVEACNSCFNTYQSVLTCMEQGDLAQNGDEVIYIRSRIEDLRGRRWVTRLGP